MWASELCRYLHDEYLALTMQVLKLLTEVCMAPVHVWDRGIDLVWLPCLCNVCRYFAMHDKQLYVDRVNNVEEILSHVTVM